MENYVAAHDKLVRHLQMTIESANRGYARVSMPLTENHKNGMGVAHGGAIFSLADVAFGAAANAGRENGVSAAIEFLRPGKIGPLTAEARVVRDGQHVQNYDVQIFDGSGALIARTMATGFLTDVPLPR